MKFLLLLLPSVAALPVPARVPRRHAPVTALHGEPQQPDANRLLTLLNQAIADEDYERCAALRDQMPGAPTCAWQELGVPEWLSDRLDRLGFVLPTLVQRHALAALQTGDDAACCAPTGSGKTLSYLLPLLSQLSDELLGDQLDDFLAQYRARSAQRGEETGRLPTPAVLIVVPTRELGVQVSLLAYRLLGGSENNPTIQPYGHTPFRDLKARFKPGDRSNMFTYTGPRQVKVAGVWDAETLYASRSRATYDLGEVDL
jgi:hypothetical protein